jgi:hypothetical protein
MKVMVLMNIWANLNITNSLSPNEGDKNVYKRKTSFAAAAILEALKRQCRHWLLRLERSARPLNFNN